MGARSTNCWILAVLGASCVWNLGCQPSDTDMGSTCDKLLCADSNPCTTDRCGPTGACVHDPATGPACSDGAKCLTAGICQAGVCTGPANSCNDSIACTVDSCGPTGCLSTPGAPSTCDDGNGCTSDLCVAQNGCVYQPLAGVCNDGSLCTGPDSCNGGGCAAGPATAICDDGDPCTSDTCIPAQGNCQFAPRTGPCDDGKPCTLGDSCLSGSCTAPTNCACAQAAGLAVSATENCATPDDDNCNGKVNEASACGQPTYRFSEAPQCGGTCYYDELHNIAVQGPTKAEDASGFLQWASGQLVDGKRGSDDWSADLGSGSAYEWVGWSSSGPIVTVQFAAPRKLDLVRLGLCNGNIGAVDQPPQVSVRFSLDGQTWSPPQVFSLDAATMPAIPKGKRGDVALVVPLQVAKFVEIGFATPGSWTFVDELEFD